MIYLSLGSNLGDKSSHLAQARNGLAQVGTIVQESDIIETEPFGTADQLFLNQVLSFETDMTPGELLDYIKELETKIGRVPREHWDNREIDIDILLWNEEEIDIVSPQGRPLIIPHFGLPDRPFLHTLLTQLDYNYGRHHR